MTAERCAPAEQQPPRPAVEAANARHGRRQTAKITAAETIRSHATPSTLHPCEQQHGERRAEVVKDGADDKIGMGRRSSHLL